MKRETTQQVTTHLLMLLVVFTLVFFSHVPFVESLGVAPSSYTLDYEADSTQNLNLRVLNSDGEARKILIRVQGELATQVNLPEYYVDFKTGETSKTIPYTLTQPSALSPGNHIIDVVLIELPDEVTGNNIIAVSNTVLQKITLFSPYAGSFISGTLYVDEADVGQPITFTVRATNKGTKNALVSGEIIVRGSANNELVRIPLSSKNIGVAASAQLTAVLSGLENSGFYTAEAILFYENKNMQLTKNFQVGAVSLRPISLEVEQFVLGEIVRVNLEVQSDWNQDVDDVYAIVDVLDGVGSKVTSFQTIGSTALGSTIPARQRKTLEGFWDTDGLQIGNYDLLVTLYYAQKTSEKLFSSVVGIDSLQVINNQLSGNVVSKGESDGNPYSLLIILIIVLIVVNAGVLLYVKKKGGKQ